ncbi:hypothetical protein HDV05_004778 [Chytridiales sp. JEL 0842]|nr:hypothetical protein HDV05_004778 [Chytridiales sp. JEL 0842]
MTHEEETVVAPAAEQEEVVDAEAHNEDDGDVYSLWIIMDSDRDFGSILSLLNFIYAIALAVFSAIGLLLISRSTAALASAPRYKIPLVLYAASTVLTALLKGTIEIWGTVILVNPQTQETLVQDCVDRNLDSTDVLLRNTTLVRTICQNSARRIVPFAISESVFTLLFAAYFSFIICAYAYDFYTSYEKYFHHLTVGVDDQFPSGAYDHSTYTQQYFNQPMLPTYEPQAPPYTGGNTAQPPKSPDASQQPNGAIELQQIRTNDELPATNHHVAAATLDPRRDT